MKLLLVIAATALLFHASELFAQDHAFAMARGEGEAPPSGVSNSGPLSASVHYDSTSDPYWGGSPNLAIGDTSVSADQVHKDITLKANATANGNGGDPSSANASASWSDHITLSNPSGVLITSGDIVYYKVSFEGTLSGTSAGSFVSEGVSNGDVIFTNFDENTPGTYGPAELPSGPLSLSEVMTFGMDFSMGINVSGADPSGSADFSHTAHFVSFFVGDANGNPVPGLDALVFTGDSGFVYPVQAVPEPGTALLLVFGAGIVIGLRFVREPNQAMQRTAGRSASPFR